MIRYTINEQIPNLDSSGSASVTLQATLRNLVACSLEGQQALLCHTEVCGVNQAASRTTASMYVRITRVYRPGA